MNADTTGNYNMKQRNCPKSGLKGEKKEQVRKITVLFNPKQGMLHPRKEIKTLEICKYYMSQAM